MKELTHKEKVMFLRDEVKAKDAELLKDLQDIADVSNKLFKRKITQAINAIQYWQDMYLAKNYILADMEEKLYKAENRAKKGAVNGEQSKEAEHL